MIFTPSYNLAMEACTSSLGDILETRFSSSLGPLDPHKIAIMGFDVSRALNYLHNEALLLHGKPIKYFHYFKFNTKIL